MLTAIDLKIFCNPDDRRDALKAPFSDEKFTYATDGHICIRVPRIQGVTSDSGVSLLKYMTFDHAEMTTWHFIPDEIPADKRSECKSCNGTGKVLTCPDCEGDGEVEYKFFSKSGKSYDLDHECPVCEGTGKLNGSADDRCEDCTGKGYIDDPVPVRIEAVGLSISSHLLRRVQNLPGIMVAAKEHRADELPPIRFRFDGGDGLIMPTRDKAAFA